MRFLLLILWLCAVAVAAIPASACDCPVWTAEDVYNRSSLLFVGRAQPFDWDRNRQSYEVLVVLKGQPQTPTEHLIDYGHELDNCRPIQGEGTIASVAITDVSPRPSVCDGSGNLLGHRDELASFFELGGARPATLSGPAVAALLEPKLVGGKGDVWFVGAGPSGETIEVAGRTVHLVDAIDGLPAGEVFEAGRVLQLADIVFVELVGKPLNDAEALLQVPAEGSPQLIFAYWRGGVIRIPEPK